MELKETSIFRRRVDKLLTVDAYTALRADLIVDPAAGDIIRGSGGIRKLRWAAKGQGKSGGVRIIYYWAVAANEILLLFIFAKNEQSDLTAKQLRDLQRVIEGEYP